MRPLHIQLPDGLRVRLRPIRLQVLKRIQDDGRIGVVEQFDGNFIQDGCCGVVRDPSEERVIATGFAFCDLALQERAGIIGAEAH